MLQLRAFADLRDLLAETMRSEGSGHHG
jgi:hypothetical protein